MGRMVHLPELGEGITSGEVVTVLVSPGDTVESGGGLVEVESDKATAEIPAEEGGTVQEVHVQAGDTVEVGDPLVTFEDAGSSGSGGEGGGETESAQTRSGGDDADGDSASSAKSDRVSKPKRKSGAPASSGGGTIEFTLPELGEGAEEGDVVSLAVKEGDEVAEGETLLELEAGKATLEIPSPTGGTIRALHVKEGQTVSVGDRVATIADGSAPGASREAETEEESDSGEDGEKASSGAEQTSGGEPGGDTGGEAGDDVARRAGLVMATPTVRRLARELGIDIHAVEGSGPGGRILERDVKTIARRIITTGDSIGREGRSALREEAAPFDRWGPVRHEKLSAVRRATARQMGRSWSEVARVTHFAKADFGPVEDVRARLKDRGQKVSLTAILVKILGTALRAHPRFNATIDLDRQEALLREYVNIGVAVDTPRGLLVPVVRQVARRGIRAINDDLADLAARAREGKLSMGQMQGAGFSLSNIGGLGGGWFTPIVSVPEVAILGVGAAVTEPVWSGEGFEPKRMCPLSLSYDHRLVDGADAARFLGWIVDALENPLLTMLEGD